MRAVKNSPLLPPKQLPGAARKRKRASRGLSEARQIAACYYSSQVPWNGVCLRVNTSPAEEAKALRFANIVRAIKGVEAAGLQVCAVEITLSGSINISTTAPRI